MRTSAGIIFGCLLVASIASLAVGQSSQPASNLIHRSAPGSPNAAASSQPSPSSISKSVTDAGGALRVGLSLAAVLGLILLMFWASRRLLPRRAFDAGSQAVAVLARTPLSPRHRIVLLRVGKRILVVGESGQQLTTLCEITDADEAAALLGQIRGEQTAASRSFAALLSGARERFRVAASATPQAADDPAPVASQGDEIASTQQELDGLTERVRVLARQFGRA